ncbi:MAG: 5-methyltetrahydropteroyltriglutamate--homocysteine methyltransferase [SAR324 cluster bacterium]|nr:5-methyltetrahydropteroyltriglutamate--homocysteine methyltransferase [SAR324 cluster bacterium]
MAEKLFPATIVGSYPQPGWLIDKEKLSKMVPRVPEKSLWRIPEPMLEQAQDDATILAIRDQERAGLDIVSDGEIRRESYFNRFANALEGIDLDSPGEALNRRGEMQMVPRVTGPIRRARPVEVRDLEFLRANTDRKVKMTVPGPFTMTQLAQDDHYGDERALGLAYAEAVKAEIRDLFAAGADLVQVDEPYMQSQPDKAREYGVEVLSRALEDAAGATCVHICFGYAQLVEGRPSGYSFLKELAHTPCQQISIETAQSNLDCAVLKEIPEKSILVGVLDLSDKNVEPPQTVAARIRRALEHIPAERIIVAPDCGMKYLPRDSAFGKLCSLVEGAALVRAELT